MSRTILTAAAAVAMAATVPHAPAIAQEGAAITVTGPTMRNSGEPASGVRQPVLISSSVTVDLADLDLRTEYGRWLLEQRLRLAADAACDELDAIDPPSGMSGGVAYGDCRSLAMRRAEPQLRRAIRAAG